MQTCSTTNELVMLNPYTINTNTFVVSEGSVGDTTATVWTFVNGDATGPDATHLAPTLYPAAGRWVKNAGGSGGTNIFNTIIVTNLTVISNLTADTLWTNKASVLQPSNLTLPVMLTNQLSFSEGMTNVLARTNDTDLAYFGPAMVGRNTVIAVYRGANPVYFGSTPAGGAIVQSPSNRAILDVNNVQAFWDGASFRPGGIGVLGAEVNPWTNSWFSGKVYTEGFWDNSTTNYSRLALSHTGTNGAIVFDSQSAGTAGNAVAFSFMTNGVLLLSLTNSANGDARLTPRTGFLFLKAATVFEGNAIPDLDNTRNFGSSASSGAWHDSWFKGTHYIESTNDGLGNTSWMKILSTNGVGIFDLANAGTGFAPAGFSFRTNGVEVGWFGGSSNSFVKLAGDTMTGQLIIKDSGHNSIGLARSDGVQTTLLSDFFGVRLGYDQSLSFSGTGVFATDTFLLRDAPNTLALRNGVNAQTFNIYGSYTDASNYEATRIICGAFPGIFNVRAGTGLARNLYLGATGETWFFSSSGDHFLASTDNTYDIGASGANRPRNVYAANGVFAPNGTISQIVFDSARIYVTSKSVVDFTGNDGVLLLRNFGGTDFSRLQFGSTTTNFPAIASVSDTNGMPYLKVVDATGVNLRKLVVGGLQGGYQKVLTSTTAADFLYVAVPNTNMIGGKLFWTVSSTDGTEAQQQTGETMFGAVAKGTAVTAGLTTITNAAVCSGGTLTVGLASNVTTNNVWALGVTATTSLTTTNLLIRWRLETPSTFQVNAL